MDPSWPMRIYPQTSELAHVVNTRSKDELKISFLTLNISGNQQSHRVSNLVTDKCCFN